MSRKSFIAALLLLLLTLTMTLCAASSASAASHPKGLRFRVVKHARTYDVVRGHHRTLVVRDHQRYVKRYLKRHGMRRYRVLKRGHHFVVLKRVPLLDAAVSTAPAILPGAPLSVGLPSSASSVSPGFSITAANDGQADTRWAASAHTFPQWWTVDLGAPTTVYGVKASWYGAKRTFRYRIETSLDGVAFTTVADRSRNQTRGATTDALRVVARYVRVTVLGVSPSGVSASAYEITVNGDAGKTPTPTPSGTPAAAFNVMDYGAHADGVTNDSDHIAAAVAAAGGAGTVYFPAGTYYLASTYSPPSGITFTGPVHDKDSVPLAWLQGSVCFGSNSSFSDLRIGPAVAGTCGLYNAANTTSGTNFSRCQFRGGGGGEGRNATAVWLGRAVSDLTFSDCNFECNLATGPAGTTHTYTNVYIQPAVVSPSIDNLLFKGCHFGVSNGVTTGCPMFNVEIWSDPNSVNRTHGFRDINFEDCIFESGQGELLNYSGSTLADGVTPNDGYSHVTNCVFKGDGAPGYTWNSSLVIEQGCGYIEVDGCTFYRGSGSAIVTQRSSEQDHLAHCTITNNIFDQTNNVLDTGITRVAYNTIEVNGHLNTVTGNTITSLPTEQRPGIEIKGSDNAVTGNAVTIATNGWYTIDIVAGANNNVVTGNTLNKPIRNNGTNNTL